MLPLVLAWGRNQNHAVAKVVFDVYDFMQECVLMLPQPTGDAAMNDMISSLAGLFFYECAWALPQVAISYVAGTVAVALGTSGRLAR